MKAEPAPNPPPPASLGNDVVPTTRNGTVREPPVGSCTVHAQDRTHVCPDLVHGRDSERHVVLTCGKPTVHFRQEHGSTNRLAGKGEDVMPVDRHLVGGRQHDRADGVVAPQTGDPRGGVTRTTVRVREGQLVVAAVERRCRCEIRQAVSEYDRCAERHDRQHASEQCGAHWERGNAASAFQGVTDPDHRAWRRACGDHFRRDDRRVPLR